MYISNQIEPCVVRLSHPCRQWPDTITTAQPRFCGHLTSVMPKNAKRISGDMMLKSS
jgi:hypothetical protein